MRPPETRHPHTHSLYGLTWQCNVRLAGLAEGARTADATQVYLEAGEVPWPRQSDFDVIHERTDGVDGALRLHKHHDDPEFRYCYADGTAFHIDGAANSIRGGWPATLTLANACTYLLGPVAGLVTRLHGRTCLHASAVVQGAHAIAFMGAAGAGKSTTAAALVRRGLELLTDDIAVLVPDGNTPCGFTVLPGTPRLNLWPGSTTALLGTRSALPELVPGHAYFDKQFLQVDPERQRVRSVPLGAIYCGVVADVERPSFRTLTQAQAALALACNAYAPYLLNAESRAKDFDVWTRIASQTPVREVTFRADLNALDVLVDALYDDVRRL